MEKRQDFGLLRQAVVTNEGDSAHAEVAVFEYLCLAATAKSRFGGRSAALALGGHLALERVHVDGQTALPGDVLRLLDGEAVGVVQIECFFSAYCAAPASHMSEVVGCITFLPACLVE